MNFFRFHLSRRLSCFFVPPVLAYLTLSGITVANYLPCSYQNTSLICYYSDNSWTFYGSITPALHEPYSGTCYIRAPSSVREEKVERNPVCQLIAVRFGPRFFTDVARAIDSTNDGMIFTGWCAVKKPTASILLWIQWLWSRFDRFIGSKRLTRYLGLSPLPAATVNFTVPVKRPFTIVCKFL